MRQPTPWRRATESSYEFIRNYQYQFAHATIQEFLLAHAILDDAADYDLAGLQLSREAFRFLIDGKRFLGKQTVNLRGAKAGYRDAAVEFVQQTFGIELVPIPPGEFLRGSPQDEKGRFEDEIQHRVRLTQPFWIGRYPVTQAEYEAVMGENPSYFKGDLRPVENIDWHQATTFCQKLTEQARKAGWLAEDFEFRLPTEAEWEYACRAGTTTAFNDGSPCTNPDGKDRALQRLGWHGEGDKGQTHPVGEKQPNAWGLYDMHGNVWESCEDRAEWTGTTVATDTYADGVVDPICEKGARRALRGGGFWIGAWNCRAACRGVNVPGDRIIDAGFRLAAGQPVGRGASRPAS